MNNFVSIESVLDRVNACDTVKKMFCDYKHIVMTLDKAYQDGYYSDVFVSDNIERDSFNYLSGFLFGLHSANAITSDELMLCFDELEVLHYID